jgi:hypothetical protein
MKRSDLTGSVVEEIAETGFPWSVSVFPSNYLYANAP